MLPLILPATSLLISLNAMLVVSIYKSPFCQRGRMLKFIRIFNMLSMSLIFGTSCRIVMPFVRIVEAMIGKSAFLEHSILSVP